MLKRMVIQNPGEQTGLGLLLDLTSDHHATKSFKMISADQIHITKNSDKEIQSCCDEVNQIIHIVPLTKCLLAAHKYQKVF